MKKFKIFLILMLATFMSVSSVNAAENETFYSKTLLGRFANGEWQQVAAITSDTNTLNLANVNYDGIDGFYPIWLGFYGNATNNFTTDKIYNLSFTVDYSSNNNRFFNWKKAMQYAKMEVSVNNIVVNYCTMNSNTTTSSEFTCEFKVSQNSNSYYEININWWNTDLNSLGFSSIYSEMGMSLTFGLTLTSNTDYGGQIVSQNEVIIGQNQQIIDSNNEIKDAITDDSIDTSTGNSFFNDFEVSDNGGISAIVTAPLSAIEKMVSGTCTPIKGSYKGKEFSFPCGDTFWADMQDVKQFLNIVLGGFLCYGILAKLYLLIDRLKDPEDDRVDVMKL